MSAFSHNPVLLQEVIDVFSFEENCVFVDGTLGRCGHAQKILSSMPPSGILIGIDKDPEAIAYAKSLNDNRLKLYHGSFADLPEILMQLGITSVNGIFLDLGVSSPQIDNPERGFSFRFDGPLDMRMNPDQSISAQDWINTAHEKEIADVLYFYGEEKKSRRIARQICIHRQKNKIQTTKQLAEIIQSCVFYKNVGHHPATRSFQAIRIFINNELKDLELFLKNIHLVASDKMRVAIISFHSLEDRIVKKFFYEMAHPEKKIPSQLVLSVDQMPRPQMKILPKYQASSEELSKNVRARSAIMRVAEFIK